MCYLLSHYYFIASLVCLSKHQSPPLFLKKLWMVQWQFDPFQLGLHLVERCLSCTHEETFSYVNSIVVNSKKKCILLQVEKQCAHFFSVTINEQQAEAGLVVRVTSTAQSKFKVPKVSPRMSYIFINYCKYLPFLYSWGKKLIAHLLSSVYIQLLYFEQDANGGYGLALQVT